MKPTESINEISALLNSLDGVTVVDLYQTTTRIQIYLTIESQKSHHWLVYCSEASNVPLHCWCKHNPDSEEGINNPPLGLIYQFEITKQNSESDEFENIISLGAHLVWLMHRMDKIETNEANRLLELWNAAIVS